MKPTRILAAWAAVALLSSAAALGAAPASAAPGDVYVSAADLAPAAEPPSPGWSYVGATAPVSTPSGLFASAATRLVLGTGTAATGLSLVDLAAGVALDPATAAGPTRFDVQFLDSRAITSDALGAAALDPAAPWTGDFFAGSLTLAEIDALIATGPAAVVAGIGLTTADGAPFVLTRFSAVGVSYAFTPVPTVSVAPPAPTPLQFGTTGVTATFTGLLPGAQVFAFFIPQSGGPDDAVLIEQNLEADAAGSVTVAYVAATTATAPGGYSIVVGDGLDVIEAPFTVVAAVDPAVPAPPVGNAPAAAPPAPELAATGLDTGAALLPVAALLLLGAGAALVAAAVRRPEGV